MVVADFDGATIARQYSLMLELKQASFTELMEMRLVLEVGMTEYAALRRTESDLAIIRESLDAYSDPDLTHELALEFDLQFHASVAAAAHNTFFNYIVSPVNDYLRSTYMPSIGYEAARHQTLLEHRAITDAIAKGDAELAGSMARKHLLRIVDTRADLVANPSPDA